MSSCRLFLALWPDVTVQRALAEASQHLFAACGGRIMPVDSLHLTLAFLGATPQDQLAALEQALRGVSIAPCDLLCDRYGRWSSGIAWLAPSEAPMALLELAAELRARLDGLGQPYDHKAFVPHITLLQQATAPLAWPPCQPVLWQARHFCLVASVPTQQGSRYQILARFS